MALEIVILSEASQTQKGKHMISLIWGWNKKKLGANKLTYKTEVKSQMYKTIEDEGGINGKTGMEIYTLVYIK